MEKLALTIVTPRGYVVQDGTTTTTQKAPTGIAVDEVTAPGSNGEFGVLPGHLPMLTHLRPGPIWYRQGAEIRWLAVRGGLAMVGADFVTILADAAEFAEDIDVERAKSAMEKAAQSLDIDAGFFEDPARVKAQAKYERAIVRLAVAERARRVV
jgi:F-type H+-transporting ATPase subunit epsilon